MEETAGGSEIERRCARNMRVRGKKPGKWVATKRRHAYTETSACTSLVASFLHHDEGKLRQEAVWASATCGLYFLFCFFYFTLGGWLLVKNIWSVLDEAGTQYGGEEGDEQVGAGPRQGARSAVSDAVLVA